MLKYMECGMMKAFIIEGDKSNKKTYPKQESAFCISGNNKVLVCPFRSITCQEEYCNGCQVYLNWQKSEEMVVMCTWCGKVLHRDPRHLGRSVVPHGICLEC